MKEPNGYVVWEGPSPVTGEPIVCVVTGVDTPTTNRKTGDMLQVYILLRDTPPVQAVKDGADAGICGECPFRAGQGCYVNVGQGPRAVWQAYKDGKYPEMRGWEFALLYTPGRKVRLGAYGDPGMLPVWLIADLVSMCDGYTGYTHMWSTLDHGYAAFLMASTETDATYAWAKSRGWRAFHVVAPGADLPDGKFMECANTRDRNPLECADCLACGGLREFSVSSTAPDVWIDAHGPKKGRILLQSTTVGV